jgi:hypothetical protein
MTEVEVGNLRLDDVYATLKAVGEFALSAPACEDLRLDHRAALLTCNRRQPHGRDGSYKMTGDDDDGPETFSKASAASFGVFAAMPFGVGTPYW